MSVVGRYKQGPNDIIHDARTQGYRVTLTARQDGTLEARWDYPNDPEHPSIGDWSHESALHAVASRMWVVDVPGCVQLPEGL